MEDGPGQVVQTDSQALSGSLGRLLLPEDGPAEVGPGDPSTAQVVNTAQDRPEGLQLRPGDVHHAGRVAQLAEGPGGAGLVLDPLERRHEDVGVGQVVQLELSPQLGVQAGQHLVENVEVWLPVRPPHHSGLLQHHHLARVVSVSERPSVEIFH